MKIFLRLLVFALMISSCKTSTQITDRNPIKATSVIPAHAHNDYRNEKPLVQALLLGFRSIEVDIHLVGDELYVSHNTPFSLNKEKTLEAMYLIPLSKTDFIQDPLIMLIDVKTDALETHAKLVKVLGQFKNEQIEYVISGNRAIDQILVDSTRLMTIDGRPEDLAKNIPSMFMPLVSQNYKKYFTSRDPLKIDKNEIEIFQNLVNEVHQQGKLIRLWASPDNEEMWNFLTNLGVDLINTDDPDAFRLYYESRSKD